MWFSVSFLVRLMWGNSLGFWVPFPGTDKAKIPSMYPFFFFFFLREEKKGKMLKKKKSMHFCYNVLNCTAAAAKSLKSCPILCDPIDSSPPCPPVPGILQARTLEWVAISFSNAWKWKVKGKSPSRVWLLLIPWTAAYQAPPSMGFARQEYWSGVPLPSQKFVLNTDNLKVLV